MYRVVFQPGHHRADMSGLVPVHILVAEEILGRPLTESEIVHHCDFNRTHTEPDNILVMATRKEHQQLPAFQARFIISKGLYKEFLLWWQVEKKKTDHTVELEKELVRVQNEKERILAKLQKSEVRR